MDGWVYISISPSPSIDITRTDNWKFISPPEVMAILLPSSLCIALTVGGPSGKDFSALHTRPWRVRGTANSGDHRSDAALGPVLVLSIPSLMTHHVSRPCLRTVSAWLTINSSNSLLHGSALMARDGCYRDRYPGGELFVSAVADPHELFSMSFPVYPHPAKSKFEAERALGNRDGDTMLVILRAARNSPTETGSASRTELSNICRCSSWIVDWCKVCGLFKTFGSASRDSWTGCSAVKMPASNV
ncbi:hypothetical protein LshimejAT787_1300790 [Lyophyllum shimeji]|uniref:Uncharacterized protein n=1 Tax=Lyophyllum shimeji TaxID=47721 RepID=A0A9P3US04_LYOSH|nr:hypothetical protein LshimejAT787_1300790 [Lyophyllum shimeji]